MAKWGVYFYLWHIRTFYINWVFLVCVCVCGWVLQLFTLAVIPFGGATTIYKCCYFSWRGYIYICSYFNWRGYTYICCYFTSKSYIYFIFVFILLGRIIFIFADIGIFLTATPAAKHYFQISLRMGSTVNFAFSALATFFG